MKNTRHKDIRYMVYAKFRGITVQESNFVAKEVDFLQTALFPAVNTFLATYFTNIS